MKKNLLNLLMLLFFIAGGNALFGQWAQYNADALPEEDASANISTGATLVGGTSEIIADPDSAANNLWSYNVNLDAGDELKYSWYPSYYDQNSSENTFVPAPSTLACKFRWVDTTNYFGPDLEIREAFKVQTKIIKKNGQFFIRVKDWAADSSYSLPETFDPTDWHVLRLTTSGDAWNVYLDESDTAYASGTAGKSVDKHLALFSAFAEPGKSAVMIDWMGYIEDAASSPTDFPLPEGIFEVPVDHTSVNDLNASGLISIYPNPVSDMLSVTVDSEMLNSTYEMLDITGKIVRRGFFRAAVNLVDVTEFSSGMYFIKMDSGKKVVIESFIVK